MPNGGYVPKNGISLCPECHLKAESSIGVVGFKPDDLYEKIGSDYTEATKASVTLEG